MKALVEENGVLIPRKLLGDAREVEIVRAGKKIIVEPLPKTDRPRRKGKGLSIWNLGTIKAKGGARDGSINHDRYVSGR